MTNSTPAILKGTRDFTPTQMRQRQRVMQILQTTFERFGYDPIETPILNPAETILGKYGEEGDRLTYSFTDNGDRKIALPYDLTVPCARYVAQYWRELPMPFKRYQMQRVWRAEKPQKGRLREFYQCDIDVIGTTSILCEAEILKMIYDVFTALNIPGFVIQINSRRLMNAIFASLNIASNQVPQVLRSVDKLEKIGAPAVIAELATAGITQGEAVLQALQPEQLKRFDTSELDAILEYAYQFGVPKEVIQVTPTLARGLDYYTGLVIETAIPNSGLGSVCGGGRYDNLCGDFIGDSTEQNFSGVGVSFGFERIMLWLEQQAQLVTRTNNMTLISLFDASSIDMALKLRNQLLAANLSNEIYFQPDKLSKQLKYANAKQIAFVVLCGPDEQAKGEVTVKQMESGTQKTIPQSQLVEYIQGFCV